MSRLVIPNTNGTIGAIAVDNSIDASGSWGQITGDCGGPIYATGYQSSSTRIENVYSLQERHKTYKIISATISEYKKNKKNYTLGVGNYYSYCISKESGLSFKINTTIDITLFNKTEQRTEKICNVSQYASPIFENCVMKFLNDHAEEFLELLESETKKDVINFAKEEGQKLKDQLEFIEELEKIGD